MGFVDCSALSFNQGFEYFCFHNCYYNATKILGIHNGLHLINTVPIWQVSFNEISKEFCVYSGIEDTSFIPPYNKHAIFKQNEKLENLFCKDSVLIAFVDVYYLPYTPHYGKDHAVHAVIITRIGDNVVDLIDWYPPWFYVGKLDLKIFEDAHTSENPKSDYVTSGYPINRRSVVIKKFFAESTVDDLTQTTLVLLEDAHNALFRAYKLIDEKFKEMVNGDIYVQAKTLKSTCECLFYFISYEKFNISYLDACQSENPRALFFDFIEEMNQLRRKAIGKLEIFNSKLLKILLAHQYDRIVPAHQIFLQACELENSICMSLSSLSL